MKALSRDVPILITGASSGIGEEFARVYARRGHNLTIVARRSNRLDRIADELSAAHGVDVTPLVADLATVSGRDSVASAIRAGKHPWVLINNAGFGTTGAFAQIDPKRERAEVAVNVVSLHHLASVVLPLCLKHDAGGVLNVASTAGFQALPYMATYSATKAFVLHFTEAIAVETRGTNVRVMALCPGPVQTEFNKVAGVSSQLDMLFPMSAERCVSDAVRAFDRNRTICIPGISNGVLAGSTKLVPRAVTRRVVGAVFGGRR